MKRRSFSVDTALRGDSLSAQWMNGVKSFSIRRQFKIGHLQTPEHMPMSFAALFLDLRLFAALKTSLSKFDILNESNVECL